MRFLILFICILLTSCMPSTVVELKSEATEKTFITENSYQAVYRDLKNYLNMCIPGGFLAAVFRVEGNIYNELREAELTVRHNNMGDKSVMVHIELKAINDKTQVTSYSAPIGIWKNYSDTIENHVKKGNTECGF